MLEKVLLRSIKSCNYNNQFWAKRNYTIDKKQKTKKRNTKNVISAKKNSMKMKNTEKFEITVITQENLEVLLITCVILDIKYLKKLML